MMRILVAQLTRLGDMIQTTPLVRTVRRAQPGAHIAVLVRKMCKTICEQNPDIDDVLLYEEDEMFQDLCSEDSERLLRAYRSAETIVQRIRDGQYDVCYNCTHSIASAMLFKLAGIPRVVGAHLSDDWQFVLRGSWVTYFFTSVFYRQYNALNLCDITRRFHEGPVESTELVLGVSDADRARVANLLSEIGIDDDAFIVCFQLGASENKKRWTPERFGALAGMLVERYGARIILLGVRDEAPLGDAFEHAAPGLAVSLFGKTSVPEVGALLERSRLLVTNDTGTMHIAASVACPIVLVSVGHVHFRETGPYGAGFCAIERRRDSLGPADWSPSGPEENAQPSPEQVMYAASLALGSADPEAFATEGDAQTLSNVDVYISEFAPDGCLDWYPALRRPMSRTDALRVAYRAMWLEFLHGERRAEPERASLLKTAACFKLNSVPLSEWCGALSSEFLGLEELAERGVVTTDRLLNSLESSKDYSLAKDLAGNLSSLNEEIRLYGEVHEPCRPLVLMSHYERENLEGGDPIQLARTTRHIYQDLAARARMVPQKLTAFLSVAREIQQSGVD